MSEPLTLESVTRRLVAGEQVPVPLSWSREKRAELLYRVAERDAGLPTIVAIATQARLEGAGDPERIAALILARVQRLPLESMPWGCADGRCYQLLRHSIRTLSDGGDCGPRTILAIALSLAAGVPARVAWLPDRPVDHVAPMFYTAHHPGGLWGETLLVGAALGEHPYDANLRLRGVAWQHTGP